MLVEQKCRQGSHAPVHYSEHLGKELGKQSGVSTGIHGDAA